MKGSIRRTFCIMLSLVAIGSSFSGCGKRGDAGDVKLWWAYNTENIMQDIEYKESKERDGILRFNCIKGEVESMQLMITPKNDVENFEFVMGDVKQESGETISSDKFEVLAEKYMEVVSSNEKEAYLGWYPDALIPIKNYKFRRQNKIAAGKNQGIWLNLTVDNGVKSGKYTGEGVLTLDDKEYKVPVEINVYDITIPEQVHTVTAFDIWYDQIVYGEGADTDDKMSERYFQFLVDRRVSPQSMPSHMKSTVSAFVRNVEELASNPKISAYCLPYRKKGDTLDENSIIELLDLMVEKNIELRRQGKEIDLFKKAYFYFGAICDEPTVDKYPIVRECDLIISRQKMRFAEKLNGYPDLKESIMKLRHVVTVDFNESLIGSDSEGGVQTWCPLADKFNSASYREQMRERQKSTARKMSENVWWYICINPTSPFPSYHLDANLITSRTLKWMEYDYGIEGFLFWNVCYYQQYESGNNVQRDIWNDPRSWENCNGDGMLVYPGREFGVKGPISTLRLESIRESNEDYEYLWMFDQKIREYNEKHNTSLSSNELLQQYFNKIYKNVISSTDSAVFDKTRNSLLKTLESMYKDSDKAISDMIKK